MTLKERKLWPRSSYNNEIENITTSFFIPALIETTTYRRIAGLFSSTSLSLTARGITELIRNEGKMELIVCPILSKQDAQALKDASDEEYDKILSESLMKEFELEDEFENDHVFALKYLLKNNFLEIRIDIPKDEFGVPLDAETIQTENILAEKRGIFQDRDGNVVSFRGPIDANKESWEKGKFSITVDVSWDDGQLQHVKDDIALFEKIWNSMDTKKLPEAIKEKLIKDAPEKENIDLSKYDVPKWAVLSDGKILWDNQINAVNAWIKNDYNGIFTIATSGGKTLAAIVSANRLPKDVLIVVVVPIKDLAEQWEKNIKDYDPNAQTIICDSEYPDWRERLPPLLNKFKSRNDDTKIENRNYVIATVHSIIGKTKGADIPTFLNDFRHVDSNRIMVIGDEVHHYGATKYRQMFELKAKHKLGLSATYRRGWDDLGTNAIINYFGRALSEVEYTITQGIAQGRLSKYSYHPFFTMLGNDEFEKYVALTEKIKKIHLKDDQSPKAFELEGVMEVLTNQRADILKNAKNKPETYKKIVKERPDLPSIIFGDDGKQLDKLKQAHKEAISEINQNSKESISDDYFEYSGDTAQWKRKEILEQSIKHKRPIFAMNCLDEGIDVPEFNSAVLVSSSKGKRQNIQRRGRILRKGKEERVAQLFDIVVFPEQKEDISEDEITRKIIEGEYERVKELSSDAVNKFSALEKFSNFKKRVGFT